MLHDWLPLALKQDMHSLFNFLFQPIIQVVKHLLNEFFIIQF